MQSIEIKRVPGYEEWRAAARYYLTNNIPPEHITWQAIDSAQDFLLGGLPLSLPSSKNRNFKIPKTFLDIAECVVCHKNDDRYALLYRLLWRLVHENKNLLNIVTDADILKLKAYVKAVRRDAYKITAFLRFREIEMDNHEYFVAWYEAEHYTLELKLDFFVKRFKNMRWSILTPYRAAHWDMNRLRLEDNPDPSLYPTDDTIEKYWLTYYANIFNPARLKVKAMTTQMPKKYWKNMPETKLINDLVTGSERRVKDMIDKQNGA